MHVSRAFRIVSFCCAASPRIARRAVPRARRSPRHPDDEHDPPRLRRRHARFDRAARAQLLAALDRLHDQRALRPADVDAHRARDDRRAQQQRLGACATIVLRLDQNIFAPERAARANGVREITDGMQSRAHGRTAERRSEARRPAVRGGRGGTRRRAARRSPRTRDGTRRHVGAHRASPTPIAPQGSATHRGRLELQGAACRRRARHSHGHAGRDTLYQLAQWYPRVAVYDDLRGAAGTPIPTSVHQSSITTSDTSTCSIDVPAGWIVGATGVLQNPEQVLTPTARERLTHVLESDSTRTHRRRRRAWAGQGDGRGRSARLALRCRHRRRLRVGDVEQVRLGRHARDDSRRRARSRQHVLSAGRRASKCRAKRGGPTARHALEFYSKLWMPYAVPAAHAWSTGRKAGWSIRCSSCRATARPITRRATSGGR